MRQDYHKVPKEHREHKVLKEPQEHRVLLKEHWDQQVMWELRERRVRKDYLRVILVR